MSNAMEINNTFFTISHQEQTTPIFNQSATQTDFIGTDLLELTEDEISHFEKKFNTTIKSVLNSVDYSFSIFDVIPLSQKNLVVVFSKPILSIHSFLGVFRI